MDKSCFVKVFSGLSVFILAGATQAGVITFDNRTAFEAYIGSKTTDNLTDIPSGFGTSFNRTDFSYSGDFYGCVTGANECGDNSSIGFDYPGYVWMYETGQFSFNSGISAFGLDLGRRGGSTETIALNGFNAPTLSSFSSTFFGIATDDNSLFSSVTISGVTSGDLFDDVTYSSTPNGNNGSNVPAPAPLALLGLGLAAIGYTRRKKLS